MAVRHEYSCDQCLVDLTETDQMPKFRVHLSCQSIPHNTSYVFAVNVRPPIVGEKHFCSIDCLKRYVMGELNGGR